MIDEKQVKRTRARRGGLAGRAAGDVLVVFRLVCAEVEDWPAGGRYAMNRVAMYAMAAIGGLGLMATTGSAATLLTTNSNNYLGVIVDGIPAGDDKQVDYLNTLIGLAAPTGATKIGTEFYTRTGNTCGLCPQAQLDGVSKIDDESYSNVDVGGWTYLLSKYGSKNSDDPGGTHVWYVGEMSGNVDIQNTFKADGTGPALSHYAKFKSTPVPDGGMTLMLLGGALAGLETLRRRFRG